MNVVFCRDDGLARPFWGVIRTEDALKKSPYVGSGLSIDLSPAVQALRNRIAFYFTGGSVSVSGAYAPPMTGRALKLVDWMIVSYKSGNGVADVLVFA
ncbi:MAG TPA: hypothetical protein VF020_06625 [Chthoniobacterales bacterium]